MVVMIRRLPPLLDDLKDAMTDTRLFPEATVQVGFIAAAAV
jgi:hypothetical protein